MKTKLFMFIDNHLLIIFILPAIIITLLVMIFPMLYTGYLSFHKSMLGGGWSLNYIGLKNYINLFSDKLFLQSLLNTLYIVSR